MAKHLCHGLIAALTLAVAPPAAWAQSGPPGGEQHRGENGNLNTKPLNLTVTYASDLSADVAGGASRGLAYLGRLGLLLDADLERLAGLYGTTAHLSFYDIHGIGPSSRYVGNLLLVSGLEAEPALRLNQLWLEFTPATKAKLRVGKFTAAQEFMVSKTAALFVNSTFGWPGSLATDLPSGGPSYPLAAPGARLAVTLDSQTTLHIAAFAGDPAGPGGGDPQQREKYGVNSFGFSGNPFLISEVSRTSGGKTPALTATLGGWVHLNRFAAVGNPATPEPSPVASPRGFGSDFGGYGLIDGRVWQSKANKKCTANAFARVSYSPSDRNIIDLYADAGVTFAAPFRGRNDDIVGIAAAAARLSPHLRSGAQILLGSSMRVAVPPDFEGVAEFSYQLTIAGALKLQPNLQYVVHPASRALSARTLGTRTPDALVLGLRSSISF